MSRETIKTRTAQRFGWLWALEYQQEYPSTWHYDAIRGLLPEHHLRGVVLDAGSLMVGGVPYEQYFLDLKDLHPTFTRMDGQRPWSRLRQEVTNLFGGDSGSR